MMERTSSVRLDLAIALPVGTEERTHLLWRCRGLSIRTRTPTHQALITSRCDTTDATRDFRRS
jgi:hypothetical protein